MVTHFPPRIRRHGSTRQWRKLRAQILARDRHRCRICGQTATHVDHVRSIVSGGTDHPSNLRALCATCNLEPEPARPRGGIA